MVLGYFGKTPVAPDPEIVKLASEQLGLEATDRKVVEINDADETKGIGPARKLLQSSGLDETQENLFIAATCKGKGIAFLNGEAKLGIRKVDPKEKPAGPSSSAPDGYTVKLNGKSYGVKLDGNTAIVNGQNWNSQFKG